MKDQFFLILENIRSLYNVGAIFRTAEAAAVSKIYLVGSTGIIIPENPKDLRKPVLNPKLAKTALAAEKQIKWQHCWSSNQAINDIKRQCLCHSCKSQVRHNKSRNLYNKINVFALEQTPTAKNYTQVKYQLPLVLIVGNEKVGIRNKTLKLAYEVIQIPMFGQHKSLNVATACGIVLFEVLRQIIRPQHQTMNLLDQF